MCRHIKPSPKRETDMTVIFLNKNCLIKKYPSGFIIFSLVVPCYNIAFGWTVWHIKTIGPIGKKTTTNVIISIASFPEIFKESLIELFDQTPLIRHNIYSNITAFKAKKVISPVIIF